MPPLLPEIPDLHIFFLTVGENVAIESLRALKPDVFGTSRRILILS